MQQLLIFLKDIYEHEAQTNVIYLYFSKAFNQVPHNELLLKLWQIGITGNLWWWFKTYLYNRYQCVRLSGSFVVIVIVIGALQ